MSTISRGSMCALGPIDQIVGQSLRELRLKLGLSQGVMAKLLGVPELDLIDYEEARQRAPAVFLLGVCQKLHVSPRSLYGDATIAAASISDSRLQAADVPRSWTS